MAVTLSTEDWHAALLIIVRKVVLAFDRAAIEIGLLDLILDLTILGCDDG